MLSNLPKVIQADDIEPELQPRQSGPKPVLLVMATNGLLQGRKLGLWSHVLSVK